MIWGFFNFKFKYLVPFRLVFCPITLLRFQKPQMLRPQPKVIEYLKKQRIQLQLVIFIVLLHLYNFIRLFVAFWFDRLRFCGCSQSWSLHVCVKVWVFLIVCMRVCVCMRFYVHFSAFVNWISNFLVCNVTFKMERKYVNIN